MKEKKLPNAKPVIVNDEYYQSLSQAARAHYTNRVTLANYIKGKHKKTSLQGLRVELLEVNA